jgi:hypothetical protein
MNCRLPDDLERLCDPALLHRPDGLTVACWTFPHWHPNPFNDRLYSRGWTEYIQMRGCRPLCSEGSLLTVDSRMCYHRAVNKRHRETLGTIFRTPVPASLEWRDIESLFLAVGARHVEGSGSRVRFELNGVVATFHRPHPEKEAKPYQVRDARRFLEQAGIKP